jgi:hypothetical protein
VRSDALEDSIAGALGGHSRTLAQGSIHVAWIGADTVDAMDDDPNYLSQTVAAEGRDLCLHLLERDADVYRRAVDVHSLFGLALPDDAPGRLYMVWAFLTDRRRERR